MDEIIESMTYEPLPQDDEEPDFHELFGSPVQMGKTREVYKKMNEHIRKLVESGTSVHIQIDKRICQVKCGEFTGKGPNLEIAAKICLSAKEQEYNWQKISKLCLGQRLIEVKAFHDQADGFELVFEKTRIQFSADMGQGIGYIVLEVVEIKG